VRRIGLAQNRAHTDQPLGFITARNIYCLRKATPSSEFNMFLGLFLFPLRYLGVIWEMLWVFACLWLSLCFRQPRYKLYRNYQLGSESFKESIIE